MVYKYRDTITVAAGSGSGNTVSVHGICRRFYIEPTTATTIYKVNVTDDDSDTIKNYEWKQGTYQDFTPFIMQGINTINITNSTANENFVIKLYIEEL